MYEKKRIHIDKLLVNVLNPRYEPQDDELVEMDLIINEGKQRKILNLIEDIAKYGLDPSENLIVTYDEELEAYISSEGNRRLTAIKILNNPEVTPTFTLNREKFISKVYEIKKNNPNHEISEIDCVIFENTDIRDHFIKLKHTGENEGIGRISWDRESQTRFSKDAKPFNMLLLNLLQTLFPSQKKFHTSTIETRIVADPNFRNVFTLSIDKNKPSITFTSINGVKKFYFTVKGLLEGKFKVNDFYYKEDRKFFIKKYLEDGVFKEEDIDDQSVSPIQNSKYISLKNEKKILVKNNQIQQLELPINNDINNKEKTPPNSKTVNNNIYRETNIKNKNKHEIVNTGRPRKKPIEYDSLIKAYPFKNTYRKNKRINQTLKEIELIEYKNFPIASIYLIRSCLETYIHEYLDLFSNMKPENPLRLKGISKESSKRVNKKLQELLYYYIKTHMRDTIGGYEETCTLIDVTFSNNNQTSLTKILNYHIHGTLSYPDSNELLESWNKVSTILNTLDQILEKYTGHES